MSSTRRTAAVGCLLATALPAGLLTGTASPAPAAPDRAHSRLALPAVGALDPAFSPNPPAGITDFVAAGQLVDVAVQQDGKIVAISDKSNDFYVIRYNPDGTLDAGFGIAGTGVAKVDIGGAGKPDAAHAVAIDAQNRIVVAGSGGAGIADIAWARLTPDGKSVDFSNHEHIGANDQPNVINDLAFQSDGTIVLAGSARFTGTSQFIVVRVDGSTGASTDAHTAQSQDLSADASAVAVYPSGPNKDKIVLAGVKSGDTDHVAVAQQNPDGTIDPTFSGDGWLLLSQMPTYAFPTATGVAITPSGSILVAGTNNGPDRDLELAQLLPNGALDGAFNLGAVRTLAKVGEERTQFHPLAVQPDGRIVVAGDSGSLQDLGVFRLNADGTYDTTFGTGGDATFDALGNDDANAVALDHDGNILVVGDNSSSAGFVARLIGSPDSDGDGVRDAVDACPGAAGPAANHGCPVVAPAAPEAVLKGKLVILDTVLSLRATGAQARAAAAKCPKKAVVTVRTKGSRGAIKVTRRLRAKADPGGCRVKGKVKLPAKPRKTAKVKVAVSGKQLRTKHLVAVRP